MRDASAWPGPEEPAWISTGWPCGERGTFKAATADSAPRGERAKTGAPYDPARTYRTGQSLTHPTFGQGEVTAVIEPHKIDVLFADRMRRLIHARV